MPFTVVSEPTSEAVSIEEARRHLRLFARDFDAEIADTLRAAREWCENYAKRTLRAAVTRKLTAAAWPCSPLKLPYPPLLAVTALEYYDADDADTELAAGNYHVVQSTESVGWIEWDADAVLPAVAVRPDGVRITFTTGYAGGLVPTKAKQAMLLMLGVFWGDMNARDLGYAEKSARSLLDACDWGFYG
jgi:uncharacterized phiE125 gp8 family phage protein